MHAGDAVRSVIKQQINLTANNNYSLAA